jgi:hypothetical protein
MKIRPVGAKWFHVDRRTSIWIDMTKSVAFRNFTNASKTTWKRKWLNLGYSHRTALSKQSMKILSQQSVSKPVLQPTEHEAAVPKTTIHVRYNTVGFTSFRCDLKESSRRK